MALLTGGLGSETLNRRLEAIKAVLAKYPDIELVATEACDDNFEKCVSQVENLIQTYPDLKAVAGVSTVNPPAAAMAIQSANKTGEIISLGIGLPSQCSEYIDAGVIPELILWDPELWDMMLWQQQSITWIQGNCLRIMKIMENTAVN